MAGRTKRLAMVPFLAAVFAVCFRPPALGQEVKLATEMRVLLPEGSPVKLSWVLPPSDRSLVESAGGRLCFSIDGEGLPWVGVGGRLVLNPVKEYGAVLSVPFETFFHVGPGALFFATGEDFGFVQPADEPEYDEDTGQVVLAYQPLAAFPGLTAEEDGVAVVRRMFRGDGCLYFLTGRGLDETWQEVSYEVFSLRPETGAGGGEGAGRMPAFRRVLVAEEQIQAVTGDGEVTFFSVGSRIFRVQADGTAPVLLYEHPTDAFVGLDYNRQAGLFYTTPSSVGTAKEGAALEFLKAPSPSIFLQGDDLYVMSGGSTGILKFEKAAAFREYNATEREITAVNGARFRAGSTGLNAGSVFTLVWAAFGVLWLVGLADVLKHRFPGRAKVVWVLMFLLAGFSVLLMAAVFLFFGISAGVPGFAVIALLVVLSYYLMGRRQRLR